MSLKAKLEAVIYAAEEPVTLTQLAALFAVDALEWKAAQQAAAAEQTAEVVGIDPSDTPSLLALAESSDENTPEPAPEAELPDSDAAVVLGGEPYPSVEPEPAEQAGGADAPALAADAPEEDMSGVTIPPAEPTPDQPADIEAEARRLARQRDREIKGILKQLLDELIAEYESDTRGVEIREIAGGYRMATKPEWHDAVRLFVKSLKPALKLSLPALETLAVVAYKQPVTAPEVSEIRGVESGGVLGSLLARKLVATAGRKQVIGRPILYKTTKEFLLRFGLKDLNELPSMDEFERMAAAEIEEMEPEAEARETAEARLALEDNSPSGEELAETADVEESTVDTETTVAETAGAEVPTAETQPETPAPTGHAETTEAEPQVAEQRQTESEEPATVAATETSQTSNEPEAEATAIVEAESEHHPRESTAEPESVPAATEENEAVSHAQEDHEER